MIPNQDNPTAGQVTVSFTAESACALDKSEPNNGVVETLSEADLIQ